MSMKLKIIIFFVAVLIIPLTAQAWVDLGEKEAGEQLQVLVMDAAAYSKNPPVRPFVRKADTSQTVTQAPVDKQSQLFIELCVYIIIIMVYSIYWLKVS